MGECFLFHACAVAVASSVVLGSLLPVSGLADDLLRVTQVKKALPSPTAPRISRVGQGLQWLRLRGYDTRTQGCLGK